MVYTKLCADTKRACEEKAARAAAAAEKTPIPYNPAFVNVARGMILQGKYQKDIADLLGVPESTLSDWKRSHPEFGEAIENSKELNVAEALGVYWQRAMGTYAHKKKSLVYDHRAGMFVEEETEEILPPETSALSRLAKNKLPELFGDNSELDLGAAGGIEVNISLVPEAGGT